MQGAGAMEGYNVDRAFGLGEWEKHEVGTAHQSYQLASRPEKATTVDSALHGSGGGRGGISVSGEELVQERGRCVAEALKYHLTQRRDASWVGGGACRLHGEAEDQVEDE
ncbi:hypothetical protein C8J57DRAFT_1243848 [Mycena rebaudengoi]|nr:hypothetical protein C8J57DRAFT_1243848 [Mycena rebaudengoi]